MYALTPQGAGLARTLAARLGGELYLPAKLAGPGENGFASLPGLMAETFHKHPGHVFVAACGIVVRVVAPLLRGKDKDPAVVVLDQAGRHAVSLLSGHLGGGNALARVAAGITGGTPVITTGTDTQGLPSLDLLARDNALVIENLEAVARINGALLAGNTVPIFDPDNRLVIPAEACRLFEWVSAPQSLDPADPSSSGVPGVAVTWHTSGLPAEALILRPRVVVAGVGCRKGLHPREIIAAIEAGCLARGVAVKSLAALASIEDKKDDEALAEAARLLGTQLILYPAARLAQVEVPNPSAVVARHMGVKSVCEAAALLAAGTDRLLLTKTKTRSVTLALALAG